VGRELTSNLKRRQRPLSEVLVRNSSYPRKNVKRRLLAEGLKKPRCELCGQGEIWRNRPMSMILDHINGVRDDHRLENLRMVCPNCAATLDTHCGRRNRIERAKRPCRRCSKKFVPAYAAQRYCSRSCGVRWDRSAWRGKPQPRARKVERPPYEQLVEEIEATSYLAVGRKYGVSENAVRKWVRWYERQIEREEAGGSTRRARLTSSGRELRVASWR
jgi:transposase-like protein